MVVLIGVEGLLMGFELLEEMVVVGVDVKVI